MEPLDKLRELGFVCFPGAASTNLAALEAALARHDTREPGNRISGNPELAAILSADGLMGYAVPILEPAMRPIRAVIFDKTPDLNWSLGWHQDRTICVRDKIEAEGFGPWTIKQGLPHVEPPFSLIERMVTVRIHLDPVDAENAPLLVAPGSHRMGKFAAGQAAHIAEQLGQFACLAKAGDIWAYSTPILHASQRKTSNGRRRVLQVDYSPDELPNGLQWLGI